MPTVIDVTAHGLLFKAYQPKQRVSVVATGTGEALVSLASVGDWVVIDRYMNLVVMTDKAFKELFDGRQAAK